MTGGPDRADDRLVERSWDAAVPGGTVRVVEWGARTAGAGPDTSGDRGEPPILAIHGITANHRAWEPLARLLPERHLLSTDLRGRGRSADAVGRSGMERHALDLLAVLDAAELSRVLVVGHSMGASVALTLRHLAPERVERLVLVDGGLPLPLPAGITPEQAVQALLGPALDRLTMTFASRVAYRQFWQQHPSFQTWSDAVERYVDYDLVEGTDGFRSSVRRAAVEEDFVDQLTGPTYLAAAASLQDVAFEFLRAPRGLLNQLPGLYPPEAMAALAARYPHMRWRTLEDINHYTILLEERGASAVAALLGSSVN